MRSPKIEMLAVMVTVLRRARGFKALSGFISLDAGKEGKVA